MPSYPWLGVGRRVQWWGSRAEKPLPASSLNRNSRNTDCGLMAAPGRSQTAVFFCWPALGGAMRDVRPMGVGTDCGLMAAPGRSQIGVSRGCCRWVPKKTSGGGNKNRLWVLDLAADCGPRSLASNCSQLRGKLGRQDPSRPSVPRRDFSAVLGGHFGTQGSLPDKKMP